MYSARKSPSPALRGGLLDTVSEEKQALRRRATPGLVHARNLSNLKVSPQRNESAFQSPVKPIDYLKEMRQKREELEKMGIVKRREGFAEIEHIMERGLT